LIDGGGLPTTTTTGTPPTSLSPRGVAHARGSAVVRRRVADVELVCHGSGACRGTVELLARIVVVEHTVGRHGRRHIVSRLHTIVIGTAAFSMANGAAQVVRVRLTGRGAALVRQRGRRGLTVRVSGADLRAQPLVLKESKPTAPR
jgi:hypothetical protein